MFGIPEYRLPKDVVRKEISKIEQLGVTIHCNVTIGCDMTVDRPFLARVRCDIHGYGHRQTEAP